MFIKDGLHGKKMQGKSKGAKRTRHSAAGRHEMKKNFSRVLDGATRMAIMRALK